MHKPNQFLILYQYYMEAVLEEIETAMQLLDGGDVGKIIIRPNAAVDVTPAPVQEAPPDPNVQGQLFHP